MSRPTRALLAAAILAVLASPALAAGVVPTAPGGTSSVFGSGLPATGTAAGFKNLSGDMAAGTLDASGYLDMDCAAGCGGTGTAANNADGIAAVLTGLGATQAFAFLWNGSSFDRWPGNKTSGAYVDVTTSVLPTGAALDASLQSILTKLDASIAVTGTFWQSTQPVSLASLPALAAGSNTIGNVGLAAGSALAGGFELYDASGVNKLAVNSSGQAAIQAPPSLPLPSGAATAANQTAVQATVAPGTAPTDQVVAGGVFNTTLPTPSSGQALAQQLDSGGRQLVSLWADKANMVRGAASATGTSATTIIASAGSGLKNYVTGIECGNTSATTVYVTLDDSASTPLVVPAGGGNNASFATPLATAAATALTFTSSAAESTIYCAAQGFAGP